MENSYIHGGCESCDASLYFFNNLMSGSFDMPCNVIVMAWSIFYQPFSAQVCDFYFHLSLAGPSSERHHDAGHIIFKYLTLRS